MSTALLMVAGLFGLFATLAAMQGQFSVCLTCLVIMLAVLWMFFRSASAS